MLRRAAAATLLIAAAAPTPAAEPGFAGIPHVAFIYYDVSGATQDGIRQALDAVRPTDPADGQRVDAYSRSAIAWQWRGDGAGGCDLSTLAVTFSATVHLPRLANAVTVAPDLRDRWSRYQAALRTHEAGHVRYAWEHLNTVADAIRAATCDTANAAGQAALAAIAAHDRAYDAATNHGMSQGAF